VPRSGLAEHLLAPACATSLDAMVSTLARRFQLRGFSQFKEKFDPCGVPDTLAAPDGLAIGKGVPARLDCAISGGVRTCCEK